MNIAAIFSKCKHINAKAEFHENITSIAQVIAKIKPVETIFEKKCFLTIKIKM